MTQISSGWRAVTRNGVMAGPGSTDYEHDMGPYVQETRVAPKLFFHVDAFSLTPARMKPIRRARKRLSRVITPPV
jgi:hypothetical protein